MRGLTGKGSSFKYFKGIQVTTGPQLSSAISIYMEKTIWKA
jgi:hypothetical protein